LIALLSFPFFFCYYHGWKSEQLQLATRRFIQFYGRWAIRLSWPLIRVSVNNRTEVKGIEPCVYVLNHFSFIDVFFCGYLPGYQTVIAVRSWPFKIPFLNIFMYLAGYMNIENRPYENILSSAAAQLKSGACILFFPEGHRSRTGQFHPLGKGAFRIAAENDVPIIPVTIEGTEYLGGYKSTLLRPSHVRIRFFPPMRANGNNFVEINKFRDRVKNLFLGEVYDK